MYRGYDINWDALYKLLITEWNTLCLFEEHKLHMAQISMETLQDIQSLYCIYRKLANLCIQGLLKVIWIIMYNVYIGTVSLYNMYRGKVVVSTDETESIVYGDIDLEEVEKVRAQIPVSSQKRRDLYYITDKTQNWLDSTMCVFLSMLLL